MTAPRLSFHQVSHRYGDRWAVRDLSLDIAPGELVCLLGPSGCGKSTTLRLAAGVERQTEGQIFIDGREVAGSAVYLPPEQRSVGLMFQDFALFPHLTVLENVAFGLDRMERRDREAQAMAALDRVGLSRYAQHYPNILSGGEQQRVALARALAPQPGTMLMDEPFSGLDRRLRDKVRDETLTILKEYGTSSVLVTHDPEEAMRMADRIALMRGGRLVQVGTPEQLYLHPVDLEAASFFSDFNVFEGFVEDGSVATPLGQVAAPGIRENAVATVLIRPQSLKLAAQGDDHAAEAEVVSARFLGPESLIRLKLSGVAQIWHLRVPGRMVPDAGARVPVALNSGEVLVFPRETDQ